MSDIFLSYLSSDREQAATVASALTAVGWDVWWDRSILPGKTFDDVIEAELAATSCVVVLWTTGSAKSHWVRTEAAEARERGILVPAMLDTVEIPLAFRRVQAADLTDWHLGEPNTGFDELLMAITGLAGKPTPGTTPPNDGEAIHATQTMPTSASDSDVHEQAAADDRIPALRIETDDSPAPGRAKWLLATAGAVAVILIAMTAVITLVSNGNSSGNDTATETTSDTSAGQGTEVTVNTTDNNESEPDDPAPAQYDQFGENAALDQLWISCADGDLTGCDYLYFLGPPGSEYEDFGRTCGGRGEGVGDCAAALADPPPQPQPVILAPGLICKDVAAEGYGFFPALIYWVREGRPNRMDADSNGIPCETVYPAAEVGSIIYFDAGAEISPGLMCSDVASLGHAYAAALVYWVREGAPARMDADSNGIPCETVYPTTEIATLLQFDQTG